MINDEAYMRFVNCQHARDLPRCLLDVVCIEIDSKLYRVVCCEECKRDLVGEDKQ